MGEMLNFSSPTASVARWLICWPNNSNVACLKRRWPEEFCLPYFPKSGQMWLIWKGFGLQNCAWLIGFGVAYFLALYANLANYIQTVYC
jgi:hypothetical protein